MPVLPAPPADTDGATAPVRDDLGHLALEGPRRRRAARLDVVALHPWPWLRRPGCGSLRSVQCVRPGSP